MPFKNPLINSVGYEVMLDNKHRTARGNKTWFWVYLLMTQDYFGICAGRRKHMDRYRKTVFLSRGSW